MARFAALAAALLLTATPAAWAGPAETLHALFQEEWQSRLARDPFQATMLGEHAYDHAVPEVSAAARARQLEQDRAFLERLRAIDRSALSRKDRLNYDLFEFDVGGRIARAKFKPWRIPFRSGGGFHTRPVRVIEATPFETAEDYETYLERLSALPGYLEAHTANMRRGLEDGFTMPKAILDKAESSFAAHAVETPRDSRFYDPFREMPDSIGEEARERLRNRGRRVLKNEVLPAYRELLAFFRETYKPNARDSLAASELPRGEAYYAMLVRRFTTREVTPEAVHQIGLEEVARIRSEMEAILEEIDFEGSFQEFLSFLRTDERFYAETGEDLLEKAALIAKRVDGKLPAFFSKLPRMPYGIRAVPDAIAPNYTTGRYWPPIEGVRGGLYMVNTHALDKRPLYALPALTVHEAVPGHHLQNAIARELEDVPAFRRHLYVVAFGEGWALYAEKLGRKLGVYSTAYERFGRLTYEMWRAGRLVVDTGLHAKGWSRERAVRFFRENTALSEHNIQTEVDRYISWPGQALGYKMGELKILELRRRAKNALSEDFDLRSFHDKLLEAGALPMDLLEARIERYIAAKSE